MIEIHLDYETRSHCDLIKEGSHRYAKHPSTEVLVACTRVKDVKEEFATPVQLKQLGVRLAALLSSGKEFVIRAHNAQFERLISWHVCTRLYGWPQIPMRNWRCSAVEGLRMNLPQSLAMVAPALGLDIVKDMEGNALMMKMCKPLADGTYFDGPMERLRLSEYCAVDVDVEYAATPRLSRLPRGELSVYMLDQKINDRGVKLDRKLAVAALEVAEVANARAVKRMLELTGGLVKPSQVQKLKAWVRERGVDLDELRASNVNQLLADDYDDDADILEADIGDLVMLPSHVREVLEIRLEFAKASAKKLESMLRVADPFDDRMRGLLQYHGAHPGRWAGRLVQPQNFPRWRKDTDYARVEAMIELIMRRDIVALEREHGPALHCIADCLRSTIIAEEDRILIDGDFSNIEGRGIAWHAGAQSKLEAFRAADAGTGPGLYELAAAGIYGVPVESIGKDDPERQIGKVGELACGFQGGPHAFLKMAVNYGVRVPQEQAEQIVRAWRANPMNAPIVQLWYRAQEAAIETVLTGNPHTAGVGPGSFEYSMAGSFLLCRLPSGRQMHYPYPEVKADEEYGSMKLTFKGRHPKTKQFTRMDTYGGMLAQNVTQATANDFMREALLRVEANNIPVVLSVHDEALAEPLKSALDIATFTSIMVERPTWAPNFPLAVGKPWVSPRYRK